MKAKLYSIYKATNTLTEMKVFLYKIYKRAFTFLGDIMVATQPPKTKAEQIIQMQRLIQTGDIICRKYNYYLDSYLIAGSYSHSGIVISKDEIIHSIAEGVQFIHPIDFIKDTDGFIILRPRYREDADKRKAIDKAIEHLNNKVEYDFLFNDPAKLYCHELSASCLLAGGIVVIPTLMIVGVFPFSFKMNTFLADNLIVVCDQVYKF